MAFEIDVSNSQVGLRFNEKTLLRAVEAALKIEQVASAVLSISVVDNAAIHRLNREHLQHDYPTDVISFQLDFEADFESLESDEVEEEEDSGDDNSLAEPDEGCDTTVEPPRRNIESQALLAEGRAAGAAIEGEIIASAEMAAAMAGDGHWPAETELTLYVVHGLLHICGYDDLTPDEKTIMRARERAIMAALGHHAVYSEDAE